MRRGYVDGPFGQVHYLASAATPPGPTLFCLHATAYSSRSFVPLLSAFAGRRRVVALDTPGYGASDRPSRRIDLAQYAGALAEAMQGVCGSDPAPVDIFGYHTGALLATEIAAAHPERVRRLVLAGVPYFDEREHAPWRERLVRPTQLSEDFEQCRDRWTYFVAGRTPGVTLAYAFDCFVDELRAYPHEWHAHDALFAYRARERLARVRARTLIVDFPSALQACSRRAAADLADAVLWDAPHLGPAPLAQRAAELADGIERFLAAAGPDATA